MLRHAQARAQMKKSIHMIGSISIALTLLRFNSLGWSVTPTFFWIDDFLY